MNLAYKLSFNVCFPEGLSAGAGTESNKKIIARNGLGQIVLRGSAMAGALRSGYATVCGLTKMDQEISYWFGSGLNKDLDQSSFIRIADTYVNCKTVNERTHNMINRHTGAVVKGTLMSIESVPPMSDAVLSITLLPGAGLESKYDDFIKHLVQIIGNEPLIGGNTNRGIGRMTVNGDIFLRKFKLDTLEGSAKFLDAEYNERRQGVHPEGDKQEIPQNNRRLKISIQLGIPRGEDILVGDGQEKDYAMQPQTVMFADGNVHWRIPGASLRGVFRNWMTRLAVRDNLEVTDSVSRWNRLVENRSTLTFNADHSGWGFIKENNRRKYQENPELLNDPILDLFGSMYKKGRIHITDSFSPAPDNKTVENMQDRMHVAIDRFYGGANEGALFNNQVLAGAGVRFPVTIILDDPTENDIQWLIKTLRALHLGILCVGSSKSSGRLEIKSLTAKGCKTDKFTEFAKELN